MKIKILLLILSLTQSACMAYNPYLSPIMDQRIYRRGVMTGIPVPIVQYNVPNMPPQPYYINRKHIKKKYRKYYPSDSTFSIIEQY